MDKKKYGSDSNYLKKFVSLEPIYKLHIKLFSFFKLIDSFHVSALYVKCNYSVRNT